jgi:hypothetical protein
MNRSLDWLVLLGSFVASILSTQGLEYSRSDLKRPEVSSHRRNGTKQYRAPGMYCDGEREEKDLDSHTD